MAEMTEQRAIEMLDAFGLSYHRKAHGEEMCFCVELNDTEWTLPVDQVGVVFDAFDHCEYTPEPAALRVRTEIIETRRDIARLRLARALYRTNT